MIQRIQSLFLLIAMGCMASLFLIPFAGYPGKDIYELNFTGIHALTPGIKIASGNNMFLLIGGILLMVLLLATIFQFKHRKRQMNFCMILMILLIAQQTLMYITADQFKDQLGSRMEIKAGFIFPMVSLVLVILAFLNIRKDDRLVKSVDRLR